MIHVDISEAKNGIFNWRVARYSLAGASRQPLLDASRELQRMGINQAATVGLFREGRVDAEGKPRADMTCTVGIGAGLTVSEPDRGRIRFAKWKPREPGTWQTSDKMEQPEPTEA